MNRFSVTRLDRSGLSWSVGHAQTWDEAAAMCIGPMQQSGTEEWVGPEMMDGSRFVIADSESCRRRLAEKEKNAPRETENE